MLFETTQLTSVVMLMFSYCGSAFCLFLSKQIRIFANIVYGRRIKLVFGRIFDFFSTQILCYRFCIYLWFFFQFTKNKISKWLIAHTNKITQSHLFNEQKTSKSANQNRCSVCHMIVSRFFVSVRFNRNVCIIFRCLLNTAWRRVYFVCLRTINDY